MGPEEERRMLTPRQQFRTIFDIEMDLTDGLTRGFSEVTGYAAGERCFELRTSDKRHIFVPMDKIVMVRVKEKV